MNLKIKHISFFILLSFLTGCDKNRVFDEYQSNGNSWDVKKPHRFVFETKDTTQPHHLFLTLRANNEYPFNNIFLIVKMEQPQQKVSIDTLEYQMANAEGFLLGNGFSSTKESKLWYKENFVFPKAGTYKVTIEQATRAQGQKTGVGKLPGILDVGFRIETIQ